jgi:DNA-binding CsgD family transcriptional regulator/sugar-specific transcriptional regulator TrmB
LLDFRRLDQLDQLDFLGLDETATAVYEALLTAGGRPSEIAVITGLPERHVLGVLGALAGLGLVRVPVGTSDSWRPVRPELAFAALVQSHEAKLASLNSQLAALRAAAAAASANWSAALHHGDWLFEPLEDTQDALAEADRLAARATSEYVRVMRAGRERLAARPSELALLEGAAARGVSVKALFHDSVRSDPAALRFARRAGASGAEVRTAPIPPLPLIICDREAALIPAGRDRREAALCIREPAIVAALGAVFDSSWDAATPLSTRTAPDEHSGLSARDKALLRLLAAGLTDEAAAKRLGVSLRTVRRQMRAVMAKLQATSRFQAGHNAAQRGWLTAAVDGSKNGRLPQQPSQDAGVAHS